MRRVLACKYCRLHKRKCVHENGKPPCSYCVKMGLQDDCELSYPVVKSKLDLKMAGNESFGNEYNKILINAIISLLDWLMHRTNTFHQAIRSTLN